MSSSNNLKSPKMKATSDKFYNHERYVYDCEIKVGIRPIAVSDLRSIDIYNVIRWSFADSGFPKQFDKFFATNSLLNGYVTIDHKEVWQALENFSPRTAATLQTIEAMHHLALAAQKVEAAKVAEVVEQPEEQTIVAAFLAHICTGSATTARNLATMIEGSDIDEQCIYLELYDSPDFFDLMVEGYERKLRDYDKSVNLAILHVNRLTHDGEQNARELSLALVRAGIGDSDVFLDNDGVAHSKAFADLVATVVEESGIIALSNVEVPDFSTYGAENYPDADDNDDTDDNDEDYDYPPTTDVDQEPEDWDLNGNGWARERLADLSYKSDVIDGEEDAIVNGAVEFEFSQRLWIGGKFYDLEGNCIAKPVIFGADTVTHPVEPVWVSPCESYALFSVQNSRIMSLELWLGFYDGVLERGANRHLHYRSLGRAETLFTCYSDGSVMISPFNAPNKRKWLEEMGVMFSIGGLTLLPHLDENKGRLSEYYHNLVAEVAYCRAQPSPEPSHITKSVAYVAGGRFKQDLERAATPENYRRRMENAYNTLPVT